MRSTVHGLGLMLLLSGGWGLFLMLSAAWAFLGDQWGLWPTLKTLEAPIAGSVANFCNRAYLRPGTVSHHTLSEKQ